MSFALYCMQFGILVLLPETGAGELTWEEPLPRQTVPDNNRTDHFSEKELLEGKTNVTLRWHFALTGLSFQSLTISFGRQPIAGVVPPAQGPQRGFENQYDINWVASQNLVTLFIFNVTDEVNGIFTCEVTTRQGFATLTFSSKVEVDVVAPPSYIITSSDQTVTAPTKLTLNCSADGKPEPKRTWTRVSDNTVVYMPLTITGGKNEESYRCTAYNGVGKNLTKLVNITILSPPSNISTSSDQTVTAPTELTLNCSADGIPEPTRTWTRVADNAVVYMPLTITGGKNEESYRCTAHNGVGKNLTKLVNITILYKPDTVSLVANTTENTNCSDLLWANLTCETSNANPPVERYQLLRNGEIWATSDYGTWIREILEPGKHVFSCRALHFLGNVTSSDKAVTFNALGKISVFASGSIAPIEGGNVFLLCDAFAYPKPTLSWSKLSADDFIVVESSWLNFTNIRRDKAGDYICIANNTCGTRNSSRRTIDVQYKPDQVSLNISTEVCAGTAETFTCLAGAANPSIQNYTLYKFVVGLANSSSNQVGVFKETLLIKGLHNFICKASNSVGNTSSQNRTVEVQVTGSIKIPNSTFHVLEGDSISVHCNFSGFHSKHVSWINASNYIVEAGNILKFPNISRHYGGEYNCSASNVCGSDNKRVFIDVQYPVEATREGENYCVLQGRSKILTCPVVGNPEPNITWYNSSRALISSEKELEVRESGCYICVANNSIGKSINITQCLIVKNGTCSTTTTSTPVLDHTTSVPSSSEVPEETEKPKEPEGPEGPASRTWTVVGAAAGGVVALAIVVGVSTWWVHKQRKCRKDTKIHHADQHDGEGGYSQVQGAYAQSGPPAANGTDGAAEQKIEVAGAIPTYAIVDKSKKSKKQADERPPEYAVVDKSKKKEKQEEVAIPTYAAVDKSKKKKKKKSSEEVPAVYAEVAKSKKKKKKIDDKNLYENLDEPKKEKKPGELLYADLGDFQSPSMPTVSISPQPLPAIKKTDPYERTEYADISQFLKGNATLPPTDGSGDTEMKPKRLSEKKIQGNDKETPI